MKIITRVTMEFPREIWKEIFSYASYWSYNSLLRLSSNSRELFAVHQITLALRYFLDLRRVKQNGLDLEHVEFQDREICMAAVSQNGRALEYVKKQDKEICMVAVSRYGFALEFVKEQDKEICIATLSQNGSAIDFVIDKDEGIQNAAIKQHKDALELLKLRY